MNRIVECVPNFSEGRRRDIVDAIERAAQSTPDVYVLDRHVDPDYNRCVLTIVGTPERIADGVFAAIAAATQQIDLRSQNGEHPRLGASDVVPFVPIEGVTMAECVEIARKTGQRIAEELHIPVFLYEAAATRHDRSRLEQIRTLEHEVRGLPDFGPPHLHPTAGAIVVGARKPLIAYNVDLETADVRIAKQIARQIRTSSGGLPALKAIGVFLESRGHAQVSMNLTDYEQTSLLEAYAAVSRHAEACGTRASTSELIGLAPRAAFGSSIEFTVKTIRLEPFSPSMVLETRLADIIPK
jgi:glutamate formiminotransferase